MSSHVLCPGAGWPLTVFCSVSPFVRGAGGRSPLARRVGRRGRGGTRWGTRVAQNGEGGAVRRVGGATGARGGGGRVGGGALRWVFADERRFALGRWFPVGGAGARSFQALAFDLQALPLCGDLQAFLLGAADAVFFSPNALLFGTAGGGLAALFGDGLAGGLLSLPLGRCLGLPLGAARGLLGFTLGAGGGFLAGVFGGSGLLGSGLLGGDFGGRDRRTAAIGARRRF